MRTLILLSAIALPGFVVAQDQPSEGPDVPGRAARLSVVEGTVSFQPASVEDWVPATLNRPMTTGDRVWTEAGSRAEVQIGSAAFRLNGRTNFSFINLDDRTAQVQLSTGSLSVRVRRLADEEIVEIDTPQAALSITRPGEYRVDVSEQGEATIATVRGGEMEANAGRSYTIRQREQVRIMGGDGAQPTFDTRPMPVADGFDNWSEDRDRREDFSESARYVSRDTPGYSDLDAAGSWRQYPEYGPVWFPRGVDVGWEPYRYGHWAWIAPWGWTWVDDAPWGYAPFHYGRWVFVAGGWGWVPGPVVVGVRPVYAPALVAWVGGPRFGVAIGVGGGGVGWFPLGPREVFVPSYRYSGAYIERVNVTNTVIVNRTVIREVNVNNVAYMNRGHVTAVSNETLIGGRPVGAAAIRVAPGAMQGATIVTHAAVVPERGAVLGGRAAARVAPPAVVVNRTVVTRTAPPPAVAGFERQRGALQADPGRPLDRSSMYQGAAGQSRPMYRQVPSGQPQQQQPPRGGFAPRGSQPQGSPQPQINPAPAPRTEERRSNPQFQPPPPRPAERVNPPQPQAQPQPQPRSVERTAPAPREQRQPERREEKQQHRENKREKEKEKS